MFVTHEPFKFPIQFQGNGTAWQVVELMLQTPWLLITADDAEEDTTRTFFLNATDTLLQFLENPALGRTVGVQLVLPPLWSPTKQWHFVQVRRVDRELRSVNGMVPSAVLTSVDGQQYCGFPIEATARAAADLALIVELPVASGQELG
jgi:hypothetical protein